jgi:hypothetical protein
MQQLKQAVDIKRALLKGFNRHVRGYGGADVELRGDDVHEYLGALRRRSR